MKSVMKVKKLIEILEKNKEEHRADFLEAVEGYKKEAIKTLETQIEKVKGNKKLPKVYVNMPIPEDHTSDYERIIRLLQLDDRPSIELEEFEFTQYVMDDWGWKNEWISNTLSYTSKAR